MSPLAGSVALLVAATLGLWAGARWLVDAASRLASAAGVSSLVIGLTVVAFGTSAPEIAVSTVAALEGNGDVAVGNVVGSNVFNLGLILGIVAVIVPFRVTETMIRRDAVAMALATALATGVLANRVLSRLEGVILLALLAGYLGALGLEIRRTSGSDGETVPDGAEPIAASETSSAPETTSTASPSDASEEPANASSERSPRIGYDIGRLLVGLLLVAVSGRVLVDAATTIALSVGVSAWLVGVTVVAAGTSLPELVTAVVATRRGDVGIAAGNIVGSNVFNLLGVLGLAAVVRPLALDPAVVPGLVWLGVLTAAATVLLATGRRVTRLEGVVLIALTAAYWLVNVVG
ncbi:conjugal transfer protein TraR [Natronococcus pandeyae]|uniref:Conjugal transfer protein TraR n=1 Tax=Natronococcus pandeyae TaxID=2055836 RepID=A0A8J8Q7V0_9EURY|nr:calcium/sodium antiporter [Natronococcus pandeyae]TYL39284.1 conjugal transfer protein TraR [Natronococcus pandeyae]